MDAEERRELARLAQDGDEYTGRKITKASDKLRAISGLAREVASATCAEYIAGIWTSGLIEGLMWTKRHIDRTTVRSEEYITPSRS
jgi:hypothetical protein